VITTTAYLSLRRERRMNRNEMLNWLVKNLDEWPPESRIVKLPMVIDFGFDWVLSNNSEWLVRRIDELTGLDIKESDWNAARHELLTDINDEVSDRSDGSTADYYELPEGATQLQHLISHRDMNAQIGEIFRSAYRFGIASHSDKLRDAKKIKFYIDAEIERLEKLIKESGE
jgi:hypothetical protein